LHVHANDMSAAISAASDGQQRRLADALRLNFDKDGSSALWPALLSRKILANAVPGQTPQKRKAPDPRLDGQIKKPGADAPPPSDGGLILVWTAKLRSRALMLPLPRMAAPRSALAVAPRAREPALRLLRLTLVNLIRTPPCRQPTRLWSCLTMTLLLRPP
jgi:hypothetical protein